MNEYLSGDGETPPAMIRLRDGTWIDPLNIVAIRVCEPDEEYKFPRRVVVDYRIGEGIRAVPNAAIVDFKGAEHSGPAQSYADSLGRAVAWAKLGARKALRPAHDAP